MAGTVTVVASLTIEGSGNLKYRSYPTTFQSSVTGNKGPSPGSILASTDGTDVDLSELNQPGFCRFVNQDSANFVTIGIWDPSSGTFYPMLELGPGEIAVVKLSRYLEGEILGTGTGTTGSTNLRIKADAAPCNVLVEAFES